MLIAEASVVDENLAVVAVVAVVADAVFSDVKLLIVFSCCEILVFKVFMGEKVDSISSINIEDESDDIYE